MKRIQDKVIKTVSIADQIKAAPVESVVIVRYSFTGVGKVCYTDVLLKTGSDGYRHIRGVREYLHGTDLNSWVKNFGSNAEFYLQSFNEEW